MLPVFHQYSRNEIRAVEKLMKLSMKEGLIGTRNLTSYRTFRDKRENIDNLHFLNF